MERPKAEPGKWLEALGRYRYAALVLLLGLLLLALPKLSDTAETETEEPSADANSALTEETEALEAQLASAISKIQGAGETEVVVTLVSSSRQVLAEDETEDGDSTRRETVLTRDSGSGQSAVTVQTIYPVYRGVLVVCAGGEDPEVQLRVLEAVKALTGLGSESIVICAGGSQK